jgi:uncharacterized protein YjbI with pentapeptide repeats
MGFLWAAYRFSWSVMGFLFLGKNLWDWLQLLIIPLVLAFGALGINQVNMRTEREIAQRRYDQDQQIALDKQREDLLQSYLDRMSELLLDKKLRISQPDEEVRNIARVRTISTLIQLDAKRVGYVFAFLREAGLMNRSNLILSLDNANLANVKWDHSNLRKADLSGADLSGADLSGAKLNGAKLNGAKLNGANFLLANLSGADLRDADLSQANFRYADLSRTDLRYADLSRTDLRYADLRGARLKDAIIEKEKLSTEQRALAIWT